ncbi:hypothetical protein FACS18949_17030 [Clostridia bacterium]|nr:hypothetical protein FACS18949_17030 [Clostridia bacterium]
MITHESLAYPGKHSFFFYTSEIDEKKEILIKPASHKGIILDEYGTQYLTEILTNQIHEWKQSEQPPTSGSFSDSLSATIELQVDEPLRLKVFYMLRRVLKSLFP